MGENMSNDLTVSGCDLYGRYGFGATKARLPNERHDCILPRKNAGQSAHAE